MESGLTSTLRVARELNCLALALILAGCGYGASRDAHKAQIGMIGMSANDVQACAGPPDKTVQLNPTTQLFSYVYKPSATGGLTVDLPLNLGGISLGGSGTYCSANLRLVDNRVTDLHFTGDNDKAVGEDGVCEPLVRGCLRQPEPTMQPASTWSRASGFHPPLEPAQPAAAEVTAAPAAATPAKK